MERIDLVALVGDESEVQVGWLFVGLEEAQGRFAARWAKLDAVRGRAFADDNDAEGLEGGEEKGFARGEIGDSEFDVVEHGFS